MNIQKTAWGQIEWLTMDDSSQSRQSMNVGMVTVDPHVSQEKHVHYENEQFIYILQGSGIDIINEDPHEFQAGMFYYMPPNITHQMINTGDIAVKHILTSVSTAFHEVPSYDLPNIENSNESLCAAVEAIQSQIVRSSLPTAIFDDRGTVVLQSGIYPPYCTEHCCPTVCPEKCPCFQHSSSSPVTAAVKNVGTICPNGLTVIQLPIMYKSHYLGSIFSGHVLLGNENHVKGINMYDTPTGTMLAIQKWVTNIAESIIGFCSFNALRNNLSRKDSLIAQEQRDQQELETTLKAMQNTVTNLKINRHFLFNTLNAIAGQALQGDKESTYRAIVDLSKMFRYSTETGWKLVPLKKELNYLQTYLHMQQLRYGDALVTTVNCPEGALNAQVPFNFLQPVIENAFTHGFSNITHRKVLSIRITKEDNKLTFWVINNGTHIDNITIRRIRSGMRGNSGHGLSLVYAKLKNTYGDDFSVDLASSASEGTQVTIKIPYRTNHNQNTI